MKIFLLLCVMALFSGCGATEPALSIPDDANLERLPVKGRQGLLINQKLNFGEFTTSPVKRSWTRGGNTRVDIVPLPDDNYPALISVEYIDRGQTFYFNLRDANGNVSDVYGSSRFFAEDLQLGNNNPNSIINIAQDIFGGTDYSENLFYLQIYLNEETQPWELLLDNHASQMSSKSYTGLFARDRENYYTLEPITKVQGKEGPEAMIMGSIGYEILDKQNEPVAAVSLVDNGIVFLRTQDPVERFLLANLCAALLLQENIEEE